MKITRKNSILKRVEKFGFILFGLLLLVSYFGPTDKFGLPQSGIYSTVYILALIAYITAVISRSVTEYRKNGVSPMVKDALICMLIFVLIIICVPWTVAAFGERP